MDISFDHVGIAAQDVERTVEFYVRLFDGRTYEVGGHTVVAAGAIRVAVSACRDDEPGGCAFGHHLAVRVDARDRARILTHLEREAVGYQEVRGRVYLRDPDGFVIELIADQPSEQQPA